MLIESVYDRSFGEYGKILKGYDNTDLVRRMSRIQMPQSGTAYEPSIESLEQCDVFSEYRDRGFGGMPIQIGMCWGSNIRLNCLEYHRASEHNIAVTDFVLMLAAQQDMEGFDLPENALTAFLVPKNAVIEIYATTLHFCPCQVHDNGFKCIVYQLNGHE